MELWSWSGSIHAEQECGADCLQRPLLTSLPLPAAAQAWRCYDFQCQE